MSQKQSTADIDHRDGRERPIYIDEAPLVGSSPTRPNLIAIWKTPLHGEPWCGACSSSSSFRSLQSLELDGGAGFFQLGLRLVGVLLLGTFQNGLGGVVDQSLGVGQAQVGDGANGLDDLDLLVANAGEDDVELGLLLLGRCGGTGGGGNGSSTRVISLNASMSSSAESLAMMASFHLWQPVYLVDRPPNILLFTAA